jgi:hypothetical protein
MPQHFGLFLGYPAGYCDIPKDIASPGEGKNIGAAILASIPPIERPYAGVREDSDAHRPASRAGRNTGEPPPETFRADICSAFLDHAHLQAQTCPPFPVNDS